MTSSSQCWPTRNFFSRKTYQTFGHVGRWCLTITSFTQLWRLSLNKNVWRTLERQGISSAESNHSINWTTPAVVAVLLIRFKTAFSFTTFDIYLEKNRPSGVFKNFSSPKRSLVRSIFSLTFLSPDVAVIDVQKLTVSV